MQHLIIYCCIFTSESISPTAIGLSCCVCQHHTSSFAILSNPSTHSVLVFPVPLSMIELYTWGMILSTPAPKPSHGEKFDGIPAYFLYHGNGGCSGDTGCLRVLRKGAYGDFHHAGHACGGNKGVDMACFIPYLCPCVTNCGKHLVEMVFLNLLCNIGYCFPLGWISAPKAYGMVPFQHIYVSFQPRTGWPERLAYESKSHLRPTKEKRRHPHPRGNPCRQRKKTVFPDERWRAPLRGALCKTANFHC